MASIPLLLLMSMIVVWNYHESHDNGESHTHHQNRHRHHHHQTEHVHDAAAEEKIERLERMLEKLLEKEERDKEPPLVPHKPTGRDESKTES